MFQTISIINITMFRLIPTHYDVHLHPDIAKRKLEAVVRINVTVTSVIENVSVYFY